MSFRRRVAAGVILARANLQPFERPDRLPRSLLAMAPWGTTLAGVVAAAAGRYPDRVAIHDDDGSTTYASCGTGRSDRRGARRRASAPGHGSACCVGIIEASSSGSWPLGTGADIVLLNTGFAGTAAGGRGQPEGVGLISTTTSSPTSSPAAAPRRSTSRRWPRSPGSASLATPRREQGRMVILTSGTTGRPRVRPRRSDPAAIEGVAAVLERIPFRLGDTQVIAAPLFHGWGLTNLLLGLGRCTTNVLSRRFDAEATLRATSEHRAQVLVVVPVMLSRILALVRTCSWRRPHRELRVIASSGSALGSKLATAALDRFGPCSTTCTGRPRSRSRPSPHRPTCSRRRRPQGGLRFGRARRDPRRPGAAVPRGDGRPRLRRRVDAVRRLHHGWQQGGAAWAAVVGRPRATSATGCCSSRGARTT